MHSKLRSLEEAFFNSNTRLAVFDRKMRESLGQWNISEDIPVSDILGYFSSKGAFVHEKKVLIPLHAETEPSPTGEYLEFRPDHLVKCIVYYDYGRGGRARIPYEEFGSTYPATRIQLWRSLIDQNDADTTKGTGAVEEQPDIIDLVDEYITRSMELEREEGRQRLQRFQNRPELHGQKSSIRVRNEGLETRASGTEILSVRASESGDLTPDLRGDYHLFEGDEVILGTSDEIQGFPIEAEIIDITGATIESRIFWDRLSNSPPDKVFNPDIGQEEFNLCKLLNPIPFERQQRSASTIATQSDKLDILSGRSNIEITHTAEIPISERRLNESQFSAAMNAINADSVYCIHGPPGTGKTRTLVEIINGLALRDNRVLVCSHSNQAIDNLLAGNSTNEFSDYSSLHPYTDDEEITVARVGSNTTHPLVSEHYIDNDPYTVDVVCGTTNSVHHFGDNIFDYAILDEAAQASIPASLIPYSKAKKLILAGDHKQLPPYYSTEDMQTESFQESLFERLIDLYGRSVFTRLKTQYRMNEEIFRFPNSQFYNGQVDSGKSNRDWQIADLPPLEAIQISGSEVETSSHSYYNPSEIEAVLEALDSLLERGIKPGAIGVITPYSGQLAQLNAALSERFKKEVSENTKLDTIDSFQGGERDVIIISFVRSNPRGEAGFLTFPAEGPRRLNVALTRARKRCLLIGDFDTLRSSSSSERSRQDASTVFQALYESLDDRGLITDRRQGQDIGG